MGNRFSTITIINSTRTPTLTRISYHAVKGDWNLLPLPDIKPGASNSFVLGQSEGAIKLSEGVVAYRMPSGTQVTVYFKCAVGINTVKVTPPGILNVVYNRTGGPLVAALFALPSEHEWPAPFTTVMAMSSSEDDAPDDESRAADADAELAVGTPCKNDAVSSEGLIGVALNCGI